MRQFLQHPTSNASTLHPPNPTSPHPCVASCYTSSSRQHATLTPLTLQHRAYTKPLYRSPPSSSPSLSSPLRRQLLHLSEDVLRLPRLLRAPRAGYHTVGAALVAAWDGGERGQQRRRGAEAARKNDGGSECVYARQQCLLGTNSAGVRLPHASALESTSMPSSTRGQRESTAGFDNVESTSCHIIVCHVMSFHIMSCHLTSCHVMS